MALMDMPRSWTGFHPAALGRTLRCTISHAVAMGHIHMGAWHWTRTVTCTARRLAAAILAPSAAPTTAVSSTRSRHNVPVLIAAHIARNPEKESWADCLCNGDITPIDSQGFIAKGRSWKLLYSL